MFGHLGSKGYTTSRGKTVNMGSYDSAIGRLGILFGKRVTESEHPYDYYLKVSVLHEFGGDRNSHLSAPMERLWTTAKSIRIYGMRQALAAPGMSIEVPAHTPMQKEASVETGIRNGCGT